MAEKDGNVILVDCAVDSTYTVECCVYICEDVCVCSYVHSRITREG